jgi:hypothetical protein
MEQYLVMRIQIPIPAITKADPKIFLLILLIDPESTLLLNAQECFSVYMLSQEVGTAPVIAQSDRGESVVGQKARYFLKVMVFLLSSVELFVIDFVELKGAAHAPGI